MTAPGDYSESQRNRNRLSIIRATLIAGAIVLISGTMQSWSLSSFVVAGVVIGLVAVIVWRLFAAASARPLPTDQEHARWPYLSKKKLDQIRKGR